MQRRFTWLIVAGGTLAACATGSTGTPTFDDDEGDVTTGVGGAATGVGGMTTTGVGGMTTTGVGGMTTSSSSSVSSSSSSVSSSSSSVSSSSSSGSGGGCTTTQLLADTGFEGGTPNAAWNEISTTFGTPLCTVADCGMGGSTNPVQGGTWFAWFGGSPVSVEQAALQQTITIPATAQTATLAYWLEAPICDAVIDFGIFIDMDLVEYLTEPAGPSPYAGCGQTPGWAMRTVDLMAYADGMPKVLSIEAIQDPGLFSDVSNFLVDDVTVTVCD